jgi:hypothetical protein
MDDHIYESGSPLNSRPVSRAYEDIEELAPLPPLPPLPPSRGGLVLRFPSPEYAIPVPTGDDGNSLYTAEHRCQSVDSLV